MMHGQKNIKNWYSMDGVLMNISNEHQVNDNWQGRPKDPHKNLSYCHFVHNVRVSHMEATSRLTS